jgi:hypothetical protein
VAIVATAFTGDRNATAEMATDRTIPAGRCSSRPIRVKAAPIVAAEGGPMRHNGDHAAEVMV